MFVFLGIMIFERLTSKTKHNLIHAMYKCALDKSFYSLNEIPPCGTIQDACYIIQTNNSLEELNSDLIATMKSYYLCSACENLFDGQLYSNEQIYIFKSSSDGQFLAYPIVPDIEEEEDENIEQYCPCGNSSTININMQVPKQSFLIRPSCLIVSCLKILFFSIHNYRERS